MSEHGRGRVRVMEASGQDQKSPRTGSSWTTLLCSGKEWPEQARKIGTDRSQRRAGPYQYRSKQGSGQSRSRSRADQTHEKEEARQNSEARTGKGKAREGHDRTTPKKGMAELDKVGIVSTC